MLVTAKQWACPAAVILRCGILNPAHPNNSNNKMKRDELLENGRPPKKESRDEQVEKRSERFEVLPDADNFNHKNKISVDIHPMTRL